MISWISVIFTSFSGISTSIGIFSSSGIFSADELRLDSLSISSSISETRSATQWAVRRASGSWSQHSFIVAQITATPCSGRKTAGMRLTSQHVEPVLTLIYSVSLVLVEMCSFIYLLTYKVRCVTQTLRTELAVVQKYFKFLNVFE